MTKKNETKIRVKLVKSHIGQIPKIRKTVEALGLKKIGQEKEFVSTPQIMGMLEVAKHMLSWEEVK
ncbi:MAG: 50S ribosomal protein L30 [Calditrichia bacterium]